ncbi:MAG: cytochrome c family protein [Alphaproteobacteria bacterium]|jgi:cytochrome c|nr:cytochrome c family protein [Alphaproteobacteria bacterium]
MARLLTFTSALVLALAGVAHAEGNPAAGRAVFQTQCSICHAVTPGAGFKMGPNLHGVVGREAGSLAGYSYSPAMKAAGFVWTEDKLRTYLPNPRATVAGTKMTYAGLHNPQQVADLVAFLATQK